MQEVCYKDVTDLKVSELFMFIFGHIYISEASLKCIFLNEIAVVSSFIMSSFIMSLKFQ